MLFVALIIEILFFTTLQSSSALQLIQEQTPTDVRIRQGQPFDLNCAVNEAWDFCTWYNLEEEASKCRTQRGNEGTECSDFTFDSDHQRVFSYHIADTTCTLRFSDAVKKDFATWKCRVIKDEKSVEATINVTVYTPTRLNFKTKPHHQVYAGQEEHIECVGQGGFPYPNLLAFVGPKPDHDPVDDVLLTRIDQSSRFIEATQEVEMTSLFNFVPNKDQQNYYVKCFSQQSDYDNGQVVDVYPLSVITFVVL